MTTETANAVNTTQRQAKLEAFAKAQRRLALLQTKKNNGLSIPRGAMTRAHNEVQAASRALRMPAVEAVLGVDFDEPIIEAPSDPSEDLMNVAERS